MPETKKPLPLTTFSVYIAASSAPLEIERVQRGAERLKGAGITVVSTWPGVVAPIGTLSSRDSSLHDRRRWAVQWLWEVGSANALWLMCPPPGVLTDHEWVAFGTAYTRASLIVSSGDTRQSIFTALGIEYASDEEAFDALCQAATRKTP
jgi:hypothetical protein